jgi:hypothetical protein
MIGKQYLLGLMAAVMVTSAHAGKKLADVDLDAKTGTRIELHSVFDPMPPTGYAPIRVVGTNGTAKAAVWELGFDCSEQNYNTRNSYSSEFALEIAPGSTASRMLLVPLAARYGQTGSWGNNRPMHINLDAGALGTRQFQSYDLRADFFPAIAISKNLATTSLSALKDELEQRRKTASGSRSGGSNVFGSEFEPGDLPEDWRGLSGFDVVMIANAEWLSLKAGARLAVMQWLRLGGRLHIYLSPGANAGALGIPAEVLDGRKGLSLGQVTLISWDGQRLNARETVGRHWDQSGHEEELVEAYASYASVPQTGGGGGEAGWGLLRALGKRNFAAWQVLVFLVVFGILVGPVNLFILAPASRRHRLFVTTPLLSLGASVLMIGILLIQDGVGGHGRRFVAVNLEPDDAAAYVTQEQASRTGLLLSSGFEMKHAALVEPLALPKLAWVKLTNEMNSQSLQMGLNGAQYSGNIFQSRAEQGQLLQAVISARARLELKPAAAGASPGAAPEIVSALGFTADELFYADGEGKIWKSTAMAVTGQPMKLAPSDLPALQTWWKEACILAGIHTRDSLRRQAVMPRHAFFAKASKAPEFTLDTLKSIRWADDQVVIFGPVPKS